MVLAGALERLDRTRGALAEGRISVRHAHVITETVAELPPADSTVRDRAEARLVEWAEQFDPHQVRRLGHRIWEVADPEAADAREGEKLAEQERRAHRRRDLSFTPDGRGSVLLRGRLDVESAAVVRRALDPLAKPRPGDADAPDLRSPGCRAADALIEVCRRALVSGGLPFQRGERPQIVVTVDHGALRDGLGGAVLDSGEQLSPSATRRLACDAQVTPAVLTGDSVPIDLGRTVRLFTPAQRRALILRDRGCAFPGCDRPAAWCEAHHITHWIDGGPTDLGNGVLLCGFHHRTIHSGRWKVAIGADGHPEFTPPRYVDSEQRPMRNHMHRQRRPSHAV